MQYMSQGPKIESLLIMCYEYALSNHTKPCVYPQVYEKGVGHKNYLLVGSNFRLL